MGSRERMTGIRLSDEQNYKIRYIANQNYRTLNDEFRLIIDRYIKEYETTNGEIVIQEENNDADQKTANTNNSIS